MEASPRSDETSRAAETVRGPPSTVSKVPSYGSTLHPMLASVKTHGVNWESVGTILAGVGAVGALIMGRIEATRKSMAQDISAEVTKQLVELRERVARLEGERHGS